MSEEIKLKYIKYNYCGKSCVNIFWDWVKYLWQNIKEEIEIEKYYCNKFLEQLSVIQAQLAQKRKILE